MKTRDWIRFAIAGVLNYALIPVALLSFSLGYKNFLLFLVLHICLAFLNSLAAYNVKQLIILTVHLMIATAVGYIIWLFMFSASNTFHTELVSAWPIIVIISCVVGVGLTAIAFLCNKEKLLLNNDFAERQSTNTIMITSLVLLMAIGAITALFAPHTVSISNTNEAVLYYNDYDNEPFYEIMSKEDSEEIAGILNGSKTYLTLEIGTWFDEKTSISFLDDQFCIGCDKSGKLMYNNRILYLSPDQTQSFFGILSKYGADFNYDD